MPDPAAVRRVSSALLPEIYAAALEPDRWEGVVDGIRRALDAHSGMLALSFPRTGEGSVIASVGYSPEILALWESSHALSPWVQAGLGRAEGDVALGSELVPTEQMLASATGRELLLPQGVLDVVAVLVARSPLMLGHLSIAGRRLFGETERMLMSILAPHLVRAVGLHHRIAWLAEGAGAFASGFDAIPHGLFLLDERRVVAHANREAERLLEARDGLQLREGRLAAAHAEDDRAIARAISALARGAADERVPQIAEMAVAVRRPSRRRPYHLLATPARRSHSQPASRSGHGPLALVWATDPARRAVPSAAVVGRLLGLTPAESRLAVAIAAGQTVREYAASANVRENTARTTLKQVLEKTGAHRQVELVRMILTSIPAPFAATAGAEGTD